jgi:hypothetical protein
MAKCDQTDLPVTTTNCRLGEDLCGLPEIVAQCLSVLGVSISVRRCGCAEPIDDLILFPHKSTCMNSTSQWEPELFEVCPSFSASGQSPRHTKEPFSASTLLMAHMRSACRSNYLAINFEESCSYQGAEDSIRLHRLLWKFIQHLTLSWWQIGKYLTNTNGWSLGIYPFASFCLCAIWSNRRPRSGRTGNRFQQPHKREYIARMCYWMGQLVDTLHIRRLVSSTLHPSDSLLFMPHHERQRQHCCEVEGRMWKSDGKERRETHVQWTPKQQKHKTSKFWPSWYALNLHCPSNIGAIRWSVSSHREHVSCVCASWGWPISWVSPLIKELVISTYPKSN